MQEVEGDMWMYPARIRCVTTNGDVNRYGQAVMGRGVALQASKRWPHLRKTFADLLKIEGNHVMSLGSFEFGGGFIDLWSFPVKHHWYEVADLKLIERSAREAMNYAIRVNYTDPIVLPRPGCGNGQLSWADVKPVIENILDDRFHVIDLPIEVSA